MLFPHAIFWTSWTKIAPSGDRKGPPGNVVVGLGYVFPLLFFKRISDAYDEEYVAAPGACSFPLLPV
jgi:hypothetical protein